VNYEFFGGHLWSQCSPAGRTNTCSVNHDTGAYLQAS
jgi:hypothetical protein